MKLGYGERTLTGHMEAPSILLHVRPAPRARLGVLSNPVLRLRELRVAVLALALELVARLSLVPGDQVREAALELALLAGDLRVEELGVVVELTARAVGVEAPAEAGLAGEEL
jgi:hypothetical protein